MSLIHLLKSSVKRSRFEYYNPFIAHFYLFLISFFLCFYCPAFPIFVSLDFIFKLAKWCCGNANFFIWVFSDFFWVENIKKHWHIHSRNTPSVSLADFQQNSDINHNNLNICLFQCSPNGFAFFFFEHLLSIAFPLQRRGLYPV